MELSWDISLELGTVEINLVGLILPESGLHISAEGEDVAELWQGVVINRLDGESVIEFLYVVTLFRAQIIHFVLVLVLLLHEPFDVFQRLYVQGLQAF